MSAVNVAQPAPSQGSATVTSMGRLLGYARVSTADQQPQLQLDALDRAGCYRSLSRPPAAGRSTGSDDPPTATRLGVPSIPFYLTRPGAQPGQGDVDLQTEARLEADHFGDWQDAMGWEQ